MLAAPNAVSGVIGVFVASSAKPLTPDQVVPSGKMIVAEIPGIACRPRSPARAASRRRTVRSFADGGGGGIGPAVVGPLGDAEGAGADGVATGDAVAPAGGRDPTGELAGGAAGGALEFAATLVSFGMAGAAMSPLP
jgi:hypothetical protein